MRFLASLAACLLAAPAFAHSVTWHDTGGRGVDIGAGGNTAWLVGVDGKVYRRAANVTSWVHIPGIANGARVDVDGAGNAIVVTRDNKLYRYGGSGWQGMPGEARDVGVNTHGDAIWIIGGGGHADGNFDIYQWHATAGWVKKPGMALRIDVDPAGTPWVVNAQGGIYRWNGQGWDHMPGGAKDIGIGGDGSVWVIGHDGAPYWWNGRDYERREGRLVSISADKWGRPWGVNASQSAFEARFAGRVFIPASNGNVALVLVKDDPRSRVGRLKLGRTTGGLEFRSDGTLRPANDANLCVSIPETFSGQWTYVSAENCNGSKGQTGWSHASKDKSIRHAVAPKGCLQASGDNAVFYAKCPLDSPHAPETVRASTFNVE